ncbi:class I glutamine amidotransferase-like protein [Hyaloraphidium curvatum]|nr:class I glutamine amidotransferase-like protein [Hyaloraphidium curvatum]
MTVSGACPRRIAVVENEDHSSPTWAGTEALELDEVFGRLLSKAAEEEGCAVEVVTYCGFAGELPSPTELASFDAVLLTGSTSMLAEGKEWMEKEEELIKAWHGAYCEGGVPLIAVCFGHQLVHHALGGAVKENPKGWEVGLIRVDPTPAGRAIFAQVGAPQEHLDAIQFHRDAVLELAPGFEPLGTSSLTEHQAACLRGPDNKIRCLTVQWHPEIPCGSPYAEVCTAFCVRMLGDKFTEKDAKDLEARMKAAGWFSSGSLSVARAVLKMAAGEM